jgi:hypothetical protein
VYLLSFGSPLLSFAGVLITVRIVRRGARELEIRSKREEVMRDLRWAAELAVADDEDHARLGVAELRALADSEMLDESQQLFIDAALQAVVKVPAEEIEQLGGDDVQVIETPSLPAGQEARVPSDPADDDAEGGG